ncbi:hypothetical protein GBAR_LOCUS15902 [Geodia barretti]|uniref:Uncharacterized protein n=1 Tax=Geodia barretti TaxID=519541 RepID=A0AA35SF22_GEOBA|nr:hypothetical protein GBAR_LOCUS15902 [Geodia barretti]
MTTQVTQYLNKRIVCNCVSSANPLELMRCLQSLSQLPALQIQQCFYSKKITD